MKSSMHVLPSKLRQSFGFFARMQADHIHALEYETGDLNMDKINFERSRLFESIQNEITGFLDNTGGKREKGSIQAVESCRCQVMAIRDRDEVISKLIAERKKMLKEKLGRIARGKSALRGYAKACSAPALKLFNSRR